jgi:hypothetical protein
MGKLNYLTVQINTRFRVIFELNIIILCITLDTWFIHYSLHLRFSEFKVSRTFFFVVTQKNSVENGKQRERVNESCELLSE